MNDAFSIKTLDIGSFELTVHGQVDTITLSNWQDQVPCLRAMLSLRGIEIDVDDLTRKVNNTKMYPDLSFKAVSSTGFLDDKGAEVSEPAGYSMRMVLPVDGDSIENPVYEAHKNGTNWAAICTGKNAANMSRDFLPQRGKIIDISAVTEGAVIEIAGDYTTYGGNKHPSRVPAVVLSIFDDEMVLDVYSSIAKAMSAHNKGIRSTQQGSN